MKNQIREPRQERSIEKKNKIIQAGYEIFSEYGYHTTTTVDIAKKAGVSTGIVYGYFQDKRDIMICVLQIYIKNVCTPIFNILKEDTTSNFHIVLPQIIDAVIKAHEQNAKLHNTLHSLATSDEAVNQAFINLEDEITDIFSARLQEMGINNQNIIEKVHLAMNIIQSFAHEYVFDKHQYIEYESLRGLVCKAIYSLFDN